MVKVIVELGTCVEESVENFVKSSFNCEIEKTRGVSASIVCGKRARIGTGFMDLKNNLPKLPKSILFKEEGVSEYENKSSTKPRVYNLK